MLGEKIGETSGKVNGRRLLPNLDGGPRVEVSFESMGTLLGIPIRELDTYESVVREDGMYGEGQGMIIGEGGERAQWSGAGVGTLKKEGGVSFRGAIYFETTSSAWSRLNSTAVVYEYEEDADGNVRTQSWEWR